MNSFFIHNPWSKVYYAYILTNPITKEQLYVGSGTGNRYKDKAKHNVDLTNYLNSVNFEPAVEIFPAVSKKEADDFEELLIVKIGRRDLGTGPLFNKTGGRGFKNTTLSRTSIEKREKTKALRGSAHGGKKAGYKRTVAEREAIRLGRIGLTHSEEAKKNMSESAKNRPKHACPVCGIPISNSNLPRHLKAHRGSE